MTTACKRRGIVGRPRGSCRGRGRGSRGTAGAVRTQRNVESNEIDIAEFDEFTVDPTLRQPDYSKFVPAGHAQAVEHRLKYLADGEKNFSLAAIRTRQVQLKDFFHKGANIVLKRNRAHVGRSLRALTAPDAILRQQPWFQELQMGIEARKMADVAQFEHIQKARLLAQEAEYAQIERTIHEDYKVSL
jgi:hypothetical protein